MMNFSRFIVLSLLSLFILSCSSQYEKILASEDVDLKYKAAMDYFNNGKYDRAATLFESLSFLTYNTERDDTLKYYWALSNYRDENYISAEANLEKFIEQYPHSRFTEEARFLRLDCLFRETLDYELDPSPTYKAISAMNEFVTEYPNSKYTNECYDRLSVLQERLDNKAVEAARMYFRMEDYKASVIAFKNILKDNPDNVYREKVLYYIALSSYRYADLSIKQKQKERFLLFVDDYLNFIGEYPQSSYRKELDKLYVNAQKYLGRNSSKVVVEG